MKRVFTYILSFLLLTCIAKSNNVQVSNTILTDQDAAAGKISIQFNLSWENSWRTSSAPNNWDAVWLFAKYRKSDGTWHHATLSSDNTSSGSMGANATLSMRSDGVGAYYYRSANGEGNINSIAVRLRWHYEANGVDCNLGEDITAVKVFAIEMVYVAQGQFRVGTDIPHDGTFNAHGTNSAFLINSENAINVGNSPGNLNYSDYGYDGDHSGPIPAAFPKGYNAFYCMKYELSQEQYVEFLNTLTRNQQNSRTATPLGSSVTSVSNRYVMSNSIGVNFRNAIRCNATIHATNPITFYCDLNNNNISNEANDGQNLSCNYLSWADGIAYADWSGLRPMTELEFEKACRGPVYPVNEELAWGDTTVKKMTGITNGGTSNEQATPANANCTVDRNSSIGNVRVGLFAKSTTTRAQAGASYYGIFDLSGSLRERIVNVGTTQGRAFTGNLGNGIIDVNGNANVANWPGTNAVGAGFRGGPYSATTFWHCCLEVSSRYSACEEDANRNNSYGVSIYGFRCVGGL